MNLPGLSCRLPEHANPYPYTCGAMDTVSRIRKLARETSHHTQDNDDAKMALHGVIGYDTSKMPTTLSSLYGRAQSYPSTDRMLNRTLR